MNIKSLSPRLRRALAIGLLLFSIVTLAGIIVWPTLRLHQHYDGFIEDAQDKIQRYQRIAVLRPSIEKAIGVVQSRQIEGNYWTGATPALTAAEIQSAVTRIVEESHGSIASIRALPADEKSKLNGAPKIGVSLQFTASTLPLQLILHGIESHKPFLFVDSLSVRSNAGRDARTVAGVQPEFTIMMTVHGYSRARGEHP